MDTRIYIVTSDGNGTDERLVRAAHANNALRHVTAPLFSVRVAKPEDLERLMTRGVRVEYPESDRQLLLIDDTTTE